MSVYLLIAAISLVGIFKVIACMVNLLPEPDDLK
jgi:hypothetical protein